MPCKVVKQSPLLQNLQGLGTGAWRLPISKVGFQKWSQFSTCSEKASDLQTLCNVLEVSFLNQRAR
jgi:hypothetical protein